METSKSTRLISRVISVLNSFGPDFPELSVTEISKRVGIPKASTYRILVDLSRGGLLERDGKTAKYRIGPGLYTLGSLYLSTTDVLTAAQPIVKTLNNLTHEAVSIGILSKDHLTIVFREESMYALRWHCHIGTILPAYASVMGKALLSELTEKELDALYPEETLRPVTPKTIPTKTQLKQELARIKESGIAFDREGCYEGVEAIAAIIRDVNGNAVASISSSVPLARMDQTKRECLAKVVRMGASLISFRLGYQDMNNPVRDITEIISQWELYQPHSELMEAI